VCVANWQVVHHVVAALSWKVSRLLGLTERANRLALIEGERVNWFAIEGAVRADQFCERERKVGLGVAVELACGL